MGVEMSTKARRALVGAAAVVAVAAPAAQARPTEGGQPVVPAHVATGSVGMEYGDLRVPRAQDQRGGRASTVKSRPVVQPVSAPGGFDWMSAAIGAVVTAGLGLVSLVAVGVRRPAGRRAANA
jgi:hypothetical protein